LYSTALDGVEDDQLSIGTSPSSDRVWIEAVNAGQSRLAEISLDSPGEVIETIDNAESPSLSPDGSVLTFLRESKGNGEAWMARLDREGRVTSQPEFVGLRGMKVREATIASESELLLTADVEGTPHLYGSEL